MQLENKTIKELEAIYQEASRKENKSKFGLWKDDKRSSITTKRKISRGMKKTLKKRRENNKITRFEVIDESGRAYVNNNCQIELSYQDEGKTLKVFVEKGFDK